MSGTTPPKGLLSMTYHLLNDGYYQNLWINSGDYTAIFDTFDIPNAMRPHLLELNERAAHNMTDAEREQLVKDWLQGVVEESAPKTKILW